MNRLIAPAPKYKVDGNEAVGATDFRQFLMGFGGLLDYYVWSDKGLHFPFFIGWGGVETAVEDAMSGSDPTGLVMYFGAGYDFWISANWSIGALFRFVVAPLKIDDVKYTLIEPGLMATFTFH